MTEITANTCLVCGLEWDDHTVRDHRAHWFEAHPTVDIPFEELDGPRYHDLPETHLFDYVGFGSATYSVDPQTARLAGVPPVLPLLYLEFSNAGNRTNPLRVALLVPDHLVASVRSGIGAALDSALMHAKRLRRQAS